MIRHRRYVLRLFVDEKGPQILAVLFCSLRLCFGESRGDPTVRSVASEMER